MKRLIKWIGLWLGLVALPFILPAQTLQTADSIVQLVAEAQNLPPIAPEDLPLVGGTYWVVTPEGVGVPWPCAPLQDSPLSVYALTTNAFLVDLTFGQASLTNAAGETISVETALTNLAVEVAGVIDLVQGAERQSQRRTMGMLAMDSLDPGEGDTNGEGGYTSGFVPTPLNPDLLWVEVGHVDLAGGMVYASLHRATNSVYGIDVATNLSGGWQMEREVWPSDTNSEPFTLATRGRSVLFLKAEDLTDKDSDGDGVRDWFAWLYWGSNNVPAANLDYSGSGNTFGWDYSNNVVPTVFSFTGIEVTNNYVNTLSAPVQLGVAGYPYYLATLVDDTNFDDAVWSHYTSTNLPVNLGLTEGWHEVWVGLRGHGDDPTNAVWRYKRLKLDYTPPALTLTSPTNGTVDIPMIQLTGFSSEALESIRYDLSNAAGTVTNQLALITGSAYDPDTWEFTTNYFHGYDVPLMEGSNTLTLHALDLAGNVSVTNFSFTLDYSAKTNPPAVQIDWPMNGQKVCGSSFLCQGWVNDPTVTVRAELTGTNGATSIFPARVGRDGHFWLENLPLDGGTNQLVLSVTDVASNIFTTNLTVLAGDAGLNVDPVAAGQNTVTGEINASNCTVWVNGTSATASGDGTWTAPITPISGVGGAVEAVAIPNTDHDGNGSGVLDAAGNPTSTQGQGVQSTVAAPSGIYTSFARSRNWVKYATGRFSEDTSAWADDGDSWQRQHSFDGVATWDESIDWPANPWPAGPVWSTLWITNNGQYYARTMRPSGSTASEEHANVTAADARTGSAFTEITDGTLMFASGGPLGSQAQRLYQFNESVTVHHNPTPDLDQVPWSSLPVDETVADGRVSLGSLGHLDENGWLYALVADNARVEVTPQIKGSDDYSYGWPLMTHQEITLTGLTVVSNQPIYQIDATNWACVKTATDDWVYIKATLSTDDTNAAQYIEWASSGSALEAVPGDPFQRRLTKQASVKSTVTATLGSTSSNLTVWVIWATVSFQMSGDNPSNAPSFDDSAYPGNALGVQYYTVSDTNSYITTITNCNIASGKICIIATLTPAGIHTIITNGWDMFQELRCHDFVDGVSGQGNPDVFYHDTWTGDGPQVAFKKIIPDANDRLYSIDGPSVASEGTDSTEIYNDFYDYVTWNSQTCSETNNFWHFQARWKDDQVPVLTFTGLGGGLITLPTNAYYLPPQH